MFKRTRLMNCWDLSPPAGIKYTAAAGKRPTGIEILKLLSFSVCWADLSQVKSETEQNRLAQDDIINLQKCCGLVEAW